MDRQKSADGCSRKLKRKGKDAPKILRRRAADTDRAFDIPNKRRCGSSRAVEGGIPRVELGYNMMKKLKTYFLYESPLGYSLLVAHDLTEVLESEVEAIEQYINRPFDQLFTLVAFLPFSSAEDALIQFKAISTGIMTKELKSFLVENLPESPYLDGSPCYTLAFSDPFLRHSFFSETKICCLAGRFHTDIMRAFRMNIDKVVRDLKPGDFEKAQRELLLIYNKETGH